MKRFIRYLYEYEQGKRMRNVGFVKVEQEEDGCILNIHGKGLRMNGEGRLQIYLIFEEGGQCVGVWQKEAENINPALNETLRYTREDVGIPENFEKIDGVILEHTDGRRYAAVWDETSMDVSQMRRWVSANAGKEENARQSSESREPDEPERMPEKLSEGMQEERRMQPKISENGRKMQPEASEDERAVRPEASENGRTVRPEASEDRREEDRETAMATADPLIKSEELVFGQETESQESKTKVWKSEKREKMASTWRIRKIQRSEISKLARCEWRLSNNNFLLHGYYNYHHLVLLERGERFMLGVPGIYHEKEAAAAGAFGFAEFIARDSLEINLGPEECNEEQLFGYWCRPVRRSVKWE